MNVFVVNEYVAREAMVYIASSLTAAQRRALVISLVQAGRGASSVPIVDVNAHSLKAMSKGDAPLVQEAGREFHVTELGQEVARYMIENWTWIIPALQEDIERYRTSA